ncbi:hypothetical protein J6590_087232 [Homalodisca vitripennis]|nr:hypothetical protein J6590_087232 [Homalodisca vitripennis]
MTQYSYRVSFLCVISSFYSLSQSHVPVYNRAAGKRLTQATKMTRLTICLLAAVVLTVSARELLPVTMTYANPTVYPCMEDWNKVCRKNEECCSGSCVTFFCKVVGIEVTGHGPLKSRRKRPRITINISK